LDEYVFLKIRLSEDQKYNKQYTTIFLKREEDCFNLKKTDFDDKHI
jgi:hypothetical protein